MSTEQRVRAYYKAHNQAFRDSFYSGEIRGVNIYEQMARVFKMPIREIRAILGRPARAPHQPGCRFHMYGGCGGEVTYGPDPFASEINGDDTPVWQCERHSHESAMDI